MRWELEAEALAAVRFGVSPLFELAALLRRLRRNAQGGFAPGAWAGWRYGLRELITEPDVRLVLGLLGGRNGSLLWLPGTPAMNRTFADDILALRELPDDPVRADLERLELLPTAGDDLEQLRARIEHGMTTLWHTLLEDLWPAVRSVAEHEISRVSSVLRTHGWKGVFDSLDADLSWHGRSLEILGFTSVPSARLRTGLIMMPSVFVQNGPVVSRGPLITPVIMFPARGIGHLFSPAPPSADPLSLLVGPNRSRILRALTSPTSVTGLRDLLDLSLGSISRHLTVLVDARLATSRRIGRTVQYEITDTGRTVLDAQRSDIP